MQTVSSAWSAEETDSVRRIAQNTQISWHRQSTLGNRTFTIGVSTIGGNDIIGVNPGAIGSPSNYKYFDESEQVISLGWERGYNMPAGGLSIALGEIVLDNTSGRYLPESMGGKSELFTAIIPNRPAIINAGFNFGGIEQTIPQFSGFVLDQPKVDRRQGTISMSLRDYVDYFSGKYLDQVVMFTAQRTDEVMELLATQLGMSTAQYDFDYGINLIPFGLFDAGTKFSDLFHQLAEAENGHFYQDEEGIFKFENRQHWDSSPYTDVQRVILTGQVINEAVPDDSHLVNIVEITGSVYQKQPLQTIFELPVLSSIEVPANGTVDQFFEFQDAVLALTDPTNGGTDSYFKANTADDGTGTNMASSITVTNLGTFAKNVKYRFTNSSSNIVYITELVLGGRVARRISDLYYREQDDSSVTAYQERLLPINNDYIQNPDWAESYAQMILADFSEVEKIQQITIRAIPELQLGDLISWHGHYWRIFDIKASIDQSAGFVQELLLLQRNVVSYFRIGISSIGGTDRIAP